MFLGESCKVTSNELEYNNVQKLFLKLCFIFKQVNLDLYLSPNSSETVQLLVPKELKGGKEQIGSIQYGGVKYPLTSRSKLNLRYVEVRLKSNFLEEIGVYNFVQDLLKETDANGWIKYKFMYTNEDVKLAKRVSVAIARGLERTFEYKYLAIGIDKNILELPRQRRSVHKIYNQDEAIKIISDLLIQKGYKVSRSSESKSTFHLLVTSKDMSVRILVRHLQYDSAYKESPLPYQVYKIDTFETVEEQTVGVSEVDIVVGYNFKDDSFACLDIKEFIEKRSRVIHEKEGLKAEFYNSWHILDDKFSVKQ
jgi:hypothetical protein